MTLQEHYNNQPAPTHPKKEFVKKLANRAGVTTRAAQAWALGQRTPSKEYWPAIEALTGTPATELFPETTNEGQNNQ